MKRRGRRPWGCLPFFIESVGRGRGGRCSGGLGGARLFVGAGDEAADLFVGGGCELAGAGQLLAGAGDDAGGGVVGDDEDDVLVINRDGAEAVSPGELEGDELDELAAWRRGVEVDGGREAGIGVGGRHGGGSVMRVGVRMGSEGVGAHHARYSKTHPQSCGKCAVVSTDLWREGRKAKGPNFQMAKAANAEFAISVREDHAETIGIEPAFVIPNIWSLPLWSGRVGASEGLRC